MNLREFFIFVFSISTLQAMDLSVPSTTKNKIPSLVTLCLKEIPKILALFVSEKKLCLPREENFCLLKKQIRELLDPFPEGFLVKIMENIQDFPIDITQIPEHSEFLGAVSANHTKFFWMHANGLSGTVCDENKIIFSLGEESKKYKIRDAIFSPQEKWLAFTVKDQVEVYNLELKSSKKNFP